MTYKEILNETYRQIAHYDLEHYKDADCVTIGPNILQIILADKGACASGQIRVYQGVETFVGLSVIRSSQPGRLKVGRKDDIS